MTNQVGDYMYLSNDLIGCGPHSKVYKGKDKNGIFVAIKIISKEIVKDDKTLQESFLEELQQLMVIDHPKIIKLIDIIQTENNYYLIEEYYGGENLQTILNRGIRLSEDQVMKMIKDLFEAFMDLLSYGVVHRGIKPSNIIVFEDTYKLCDVGFEFCISSFHNTEESGLLYKSPQVLMDQAYSSVCDIWSIGVLVYTSLFGYTPWFAKKKQALIHDIMCQPCSFNNTFRQISRELKKFILDCLQVEESKRSWEDLYKYPFLEEHFKEYKKQLHQDKMKFLMNHIRRQITKERISLIDVFNYLDTSKNQELDYDEFSQLLRFVDPKMSQDDMKYIFDKVDTDASGEISFDEFMEWLSKNNVDARLYSDRYRGYYQDKINQQKSLQEEIENQKKFHEEQQKEIQKQMKYLQIQRELEQNKLQQPQQPLKDRQQYINIPLVNSQYIDKAQHQNNQSNDLENYISQKLKDSQYNMLEIFEIYDKDRDSLLNQNEFSKLIFDLDRRITQQQILQLLQKLNPASLDLTFIQFRQIFSQNRLKQSINQSVKLNPQNDFPNKQIVKQQIKSLGASIMDIFMKFDKDKDQMLSFQEFRGFLSSIINLNENEIINIFNKLDVDRQNRISIIQFRTLLI